MGDLDQVSAAIGKLQGQIEGMATEQKKQGRKLTRIDITLTKHRIAVAGIGSAAGGGMWLIMETLRHYFKSKTGN
ncbi:hypothetical protein KAR91_81905 [Candidatus Pacearchaeota archaeon]|nr:hypothetical protein [Candidatus Pacearchaeota archaeon]